MPGVQATGGGITVSTMSYGLLFDIDGVMVTSWQSAARGRRCRRRTRPPGNPQDVPDQHHFTLARGDRRGTGRGRIRRRAPRRS